MSDKRTRSGSKDPENRLMPDEKIVQAEEGCTDGYYAPENLGFFMPSAYSKANVEMFDLLETMLCQIHKSRDHAPLMRTLRSQMGSAYAFFHMDQYFLERLGMNHLDAFFFGNFPAMARGIEVHGYGDHPRIARLSEAKDYFAANFRQLDVERFYLYCVNKHGRLKVRILLNEGTEDRALLSIDKLMRHVLHERPLGVIVAHNHPQHNPMPSRNDIECTVRIIQVLMAVRVPLLDHLVVTDEMVVSIRENGFIPEREWMMQAENNFLLRDWFLPPLQSKPRAPKPRTPEDERKHLERELHFERSRRLRKMDKAMRMYRHHSKNAKRCMEVYQYLNAKEEHMQQPETQQQIQEELDAYMEEYTEFYQRWLEEEALKKQGRKSKTRFQDEETEPESDLQD